MTDKQPDILCVGSVLWDVIGRSQMVMRAGSDVPGRITRLPGGVAMNIAMTLVRFNMRPALLSYIGNDAEGHELVARCDALGLETRFLNRSDARPTDQYMAVEGANGVIAAIADAHSLEQAGADILTPLNDGTLGSADAPYGGLIALDGNLTLELLTQIAGDACFARADLRIAPASPGKADRLQPFIAQTRGTLYVNLEEAGTLCDQGFETAEQAARKLVALGAQRALVTDGPSLCADATQDGTVTATPPQVTAKRVTGAGDTFMASHIAAERAGKSRQEALETALASAATYVSGEDK